MFWKDKASEREAQLTDALNEVRCVHVNKEAGGSVVEWLGHRTSNPKVVGSFPVLATGWCCSRFRS